MRTTRSTTDTSRLERHRQGLERYGNKFKFTAMAEKVEMLCEGISYLLFQQLVGGG